jgi:hypothetical protein
MRWGTIATDSSLAWSGTRKSQAEAGNHQVVPSARATPSGKNPKVEASEAGVVISWEDARGRRESRKLPAGTQVIWEDGAFRINLGERKEPVKKSVGGWA